MTETELLENLKALPGLRVKVQNLDNALSLLTQEEKVLVGLLLTHPKRNNIQLLCQQFHVEQSTAYRRRRQVLDKLLQAINCQ